MYQQLMTAHQSKESERSQLRASLNEGLLNQAGSGQVMDLCFPLVKTHFLNI